jgi:serine/threonine-protein kinase
MALTAEDWSLVRSAFESALNQPEPRRQEYLAREYGSYPAIVSYVLRLLANHREEDDNTGSVPGGDKAQVFRPGQIVSGRFRIVRWLGNGGMGQVFLAYDEKLSVSVALKTLHPNLASNPEFVHRFRREITVAREVSHPNLCRIFDLVIHVQGEAEISCLTMEFLKGECLSDFIARNRPLGPREALTLLTPIAGGVDALHDQGIVHRDLKPSNVFLVEKPGHDPRVVVTDFGLARSHKDALFESQAGTRVGSPYFMAPELLSGGRPSIASDLYALGLILDEIVTRTPAFDTASLPGFYYSKFHSGPVPPAQRSKDIPAHWQDAILRCLDINPDARYQSCAQLVAEITEPAMSRVAVRTQSAAFYESGPGVQKSPSTYTIAVMPFSDLSPDRSQAYLCDGFAEELIHLLSQVPSVRIVARASVFELRDANKSVHEIGRALHATHVIYGSVRKSSDRLRVSVQLVQAAEGHNVWSQQFDREMTDIFSIQEEIAKASVELLKGRFDARRQICEIRPPTSNIDSYQTYLQGLFEFNHHTPASLERAIELFEQATSADRDLAIAYGGLADCYCTLEWYGTRPARQVMPLAKEFATHAIQIDSSLASAHCALGRICARYEWDWENAARAFHQGLSLGPGMARPYFSYALDYLTPVERLEEALQYIRIALELDPLSPILHSALGGCLYRMHSYEFSERSLRKALKMNGDFYHLHWSLARTLEQLGRHDEAVQEYKHAIGANQDNWLIYAELGHCYGNMGKRREAKAVLKDLLTAATKGYISPLCFAFVRLGLSETPQCLDAIEAAAGQRVGTLIWISIDPRLDSLRSEPRFQQVRNSMGISGASSLPGLDYGEPTR